jgi:antitoxin (DNA-binding transcriptional repressor) of toxin-antitoxin stability system
MGVIFAHPRSILRHCREDPMGTRRIELHFQDLFRGEDVTILVNGVSVAAFKAKTRMQTSLARIEQLEVAPGDEVIVTVGGQRLAVPLESPADTFVIRLSDGEASITAPSGPVGYV